MITERTGSAHRTSVGDRLALGLYVVALFVPITASFGSLQMQPYRMYLLLMLAPATTRLFSGAVGRFDRVDFLMLASALWAAAALVVNHGAGAIEPLGAYFVDFWGSYVLARVYVRDREGFVFLAKAVAVALLCLVPFALFESVFRNPILLRLIPQSVPAVDIGIRFGLRRAQVVFAHPIHYGVISAAMLGVFWYLGRAMFGRIISIAPSAASAIGVFLSLSTGPIIAFSSQIFLIVWERVFRPSRNRWRLFAAIMIVLYIVVDLLSARSPFHVIVNYLAFSQGSSYNRILIWHFGTQNVADNPWFGLGMRDWVRPSWMSPSADNFWLLTAMRYGLPSLVFFALALALAMRRLSLARIEDPLEAACRAGLLTSLGGVIVAGGTVHYWNALFSFMVVLMFSGTWLASAMPKAATAAADDGAPTAAEATSPPPARYCGPRDFATPRSQATPSATRLANRRSHHGSEAGGRWPMRRAGTPPTIS